MSVLLENGGDGGEGAGGEGGRGGGTADDGEESGSVRTGGRESDGAAYEGSEACGRGEACSEGSGGVEAEERRVYGSGGSGEGRNGSGWLGRRQRLGWLLLRPREHGRRQRPTAQRIVEGGRGKRPGIGSV